jgi:hypothetical protein
LSGRQLDRAVANDILRFKKETIEKLTSDGMEADQAEKYVSWRFKNLKEGEIIRIAEDGTLTPTGARLSIPGASYVTFYTVD